MLSWHHKGITVEDAYEMTSKERLWWIERTVKQIKSDNAAQKRAMKG